MERQQYLTGSQEQKLLLFEELLTFRVLFRDEVGVCFKSLLNTITDLVLEGGAERRVGGDVTRDMFVRRDWFDTHRLRRFLDRVGQDSRHVPHCAGLLLFLLRDNLQ